MVLFISQMTVEAEVIFSLQAECISHVLAYANQSFGDQQDFPDLLFMAVENMDGILHCISLFEPVSGIFVIFFSECLTQIIVFYVRSAVV